MALRILIVLLVLAIPLELPGCGPFLPGASFYNELQPETPDEFKRGELGILQPSYERLYQVIAYRYLSGVGLSDAEAEGISAVKGADVWAGAGALAPDNPWMAARNGVPGILPVSRIDPYRQVKRENYFQMYLNCNDDAFVTAAKTLERVRHTAAAKDWIAAQDMVFADCSQGAEIPAPATDPQLRPERAYQIASAKFYSEQYDEARQDFQAIAGDASSPWRGMAPYLAARCLIRAGKYAEAHEQLARIVADPALERWHASARGLNGYVKARLDPAGRMHELALALVKKNSEATIGQDLIDYRMLWDRNVEPQAEDDLTGWIRSFQAGGRGALEKWRSLHGLPWLVATLRAAGPRDDALPELLAAAAAVQPGSPAYLTVSYDRVRLMAPDDGRALAEQLLGGEMPVSARNQFRAECLRMARNFAEFLRYAPRTPVDPDAKPGKSELAADSAAILNQAIPLALLQQASTSTQLPEETRGRLRRVVAVRALVEARAPDFDAVFRMLHTPGDAPMVRSGYGRFTADPGTLDPFRDNWWCAGAKENLWQVQDPAQPPAVADFLSPADRARAAAEWQKLASLPAGPSWLGAQTVAFAEQHPQDPRVPEALYLVVRASRYGCTDPQTGNFSERAFTLLHRRYPANEWTKKTPYWFK